MSIAVVVLIARIGLVVLLYLFLYLVVRAMRRDLHGAAPSAPAGRAALETPRLVVLAEGHTPYQVGQQFALHNPTVLGRDPACDIPIEDEFVSGQHLKLVLGANGWQAQDLNSRNGTRLNGLTVRGTMPLNSGDLLDMGRVRLRFMLER